MSAIRDAEHRARAAAWQRDYRKANRAKIATQRRSARQRRSEQRKQPRPGEVGTDEMARLIGERCGFVIGPDYMLAAARAGKISSRLAARGLRYFEPVRVLAEIQAGDWRPHRQPRPRVLSTCASPLCTGGANGQPTQQLVHQCTLDKLTDGIGWTCCRACACAVGRGRGRRRSRRTERRQCGCQLTDGTRCTARIPVTAHQLETGTGRMRCSDCAAAKRITIAQREARHRNGEERSRRPDWRATIVNGSERGKRNMKLTSYAEKLHKGSAEAKAERQRLLKQRISDALHLDPDRPNLAIAREVGRAMGGRQCRVGSVRHLRAELEAEGAIRPRRFSGGVAERHRAGCASVDGVPCDCSPAFQAWLYDPHRKRTTHRSFPTRAAAEQWSADARMTRAATTASEDPFRNCDYTDEMRQRVRSGARSRARKGKAGRKRSTVADELRAIAEDIVAEYGAVAGNEAAVIADTALIAWQEGVGTLRRDFPAAKQDPDCYAPEWRRSVVDRVRKQIGEHVKSLLIARN